MRLVVLYCYRTIRLQNFKDIHNYTSIGNLCLCTVIELLDYKISKTYTTVGILPAGIYKLL